MTDFSHIKRALYDIETDGFLNAVTVIHCVVLTDLDTGEIYCFHDDDSITPKHGSIEDGLRVLVGCTEVSGHNIQEYDNLVLEKLTEYGIEEDVCFDTVIASRLVYSDRRERDYRLVDAGRLEKRYIGLHSLKAWGFRLGEEKAEWDNDAWAVFTQEMLDYCVQDVVTNSKLYKTLKDRLPDFEAFGMSTYRMEHTYAKQLVDQQHRGVRLDRVAGERLLAELSIKRTAVLVEIEKAFPPEEVPYKVNKRTGKRAIRMCPHRNQKFDNKLVFFNPGSRQQLAARLIKKHGWVPREFSAKKKQNPIMQERIMLELAQVYPEVQYVAQYLILNARIAILEESPKSYFNLADGDDYLHGRTLHIGAVSHRASHSNPNLGNVVAVGKPYGEEMRALFIAHPNKEQAGHDADGLELCCLGHYLAPYDGGAYSEVVRNGDKNKGTDTHTMHALAISNAIECDRGKGKNVTYAYLYGAGDEKLGKMFGGGAKLGKAIRNALADNIPGLAQLQAALEQAVKRGYIISLDGRRVGVRSPHAALNTLLQTLGAVIMKWVCVMFPKFLGKHGIEYGVDFLQTGQIHDEVQGSLSFGMREGFTAATHETYAAVETELGFRATLRGTAQFGKSWADTH